MRGDRRRACLVDVAVTLVLRYADVGVATYASLRVVGEPARTVTWVVQEPDLVAALDQLSAALPDPVAAEARRDAVERAVASGPFATPATELAIARTLGRSLLSPQAWQLLVDYVASPRAALFVSPSARMARVPWGLLAMPNDDGFRLMEFTDVLMAAPSNIANSTRTAAEWDERRDGSPLLRVGATYDVPGYFAQALIYDPGTGDLVGREFTDDVSYSCFGDISRDCASTSPYDYLIDCAGLDAGAFGDAASVACERVAGAVGGTIGAPGVAMYASSRLSPSTWRQSKPAPKKCF